MARKKSLSPDQLTLMEPAVRTAPCVPAIREALQAWRNGGYKGVTETTSLLLNHWFKTDHRLNGQDFNYHYFQRDAVETLIYLYEVARTRTQKDLLQRFATRQDLRLLQYDEFARYCVKMATGSGKTKVMSLAIAWQYFNAVVEGRDDFASTFLVIAPNVIVYERLRTDFENGRIFKADPIIPKELEIYWQQEFQVYLRGDMERAGSYGALYLTNIQQLYERQSNGTKNEPEVMTAVLGPPPPSKMQETDGFDRRIAARPGNVLVLNDEAHHTHDEESEWNRSIRRLHETTGQGVLAQLDFTATPRHSRGSLFTWTVFDYPLKQAILDYVVKRPTKGLAKGIKEQPSEHASVRYRAYLTAGVERWREYRDQLAPLGKKPILFIMMNSTDEADDIEDYLCTKYPSDFAGGKLLVIHTDRSGDVSAKDLETARKVAREVDDVNSPINAIVSVLMLREGWDVQNVTVIVGLRPYTAKANILPEQTIGRGLRLMFRGLMTSYQERVDIIGNKGFLQFVEELEKEEEIELESFEVGKERLVIVTIHPDENKLDKDISIPVLSPILTRKKTLADEIASLDVSSMKTGILPRKEGDKAEQKFRYEGFDFITLQKIVERDYTIPEPQTPQEVISYYAKRIAQDVKLPLQFAALVPKVREFLETRAFGERVSLDEPGMVKAISSNVAHYVVVKTFVDALRSLVIEELTPRLDSDGRKLSEVRPFPYSRPTFESAKTVFNLVACDNEFERKFASFLDIAEDVEAFAKLPSQFGFRIEYTDAVNNLRYYEPDFVTVLADGAHYLVETKGREDIDVAHKDRAAMIWCDNATLLTGTQWLYVKVPQTGFERLEPTEFADLSVFAV